MIERPGPGEYGSYYSGYVDRVPAGDVLEILEEQRQATQDLLAGIEESKGAFRYATGKWSIKDVVGHVADTERVFAYRALRFARRDRTELPGMEQDPYVEAAQFERRTLVSLARELDQQRRANTILFRSFDDEALVCRGRASGCEFTVRALLYILAGHERHHVDVLRERYLSARCSERIVRRSKRGFSATS